MIDKSSKQLEREIESALASDRKNASTTTPNKFPGRCLVCDVPVEPYAGSVVKIGGKWKTRCLEHADSTPVVHGAGAGAGAPVAKVVHLTEEQFSAIDDALHRKEPLPVYFRDAAYLDIPEDVRAAVRPEWHAAVALPQAKWQERQDRLSAIARVARRHGLVK